MDTNKQAPVSLLLVQSLEQLGFAKHMQHTFLELAVILGKRSFSYDEHDVQTPDNFRLMVTDNFLYQPSHPVAYHGVSNLLADRYTYAETLHLFSGKPVHHILMIRK